MAQLIRSTGFFTSTLAVWMLLGAAPANAIPELFECVINLDGTSTGGNVFGTFPTGGGSIGDCDDEAAGDAWLSRTITGAGDHLAILYLDFEFDEPINSFFNENGDVLGSTAAGQSWEVDDPFFGDIYFNVVDSDTVSGSYLDNTTSVAPPAEEDVSFALGWDFVLGVDESAVVDFFVSANDPGTGLRLVHSDPDSIARDLEGTLYFWSTLDIRTIAVAEPGTLSLLGIGLLGLGALRRRRAR